MQQVLEVFALEMNMHSLKRSFSIYEPWAGFGLEKIISEKEKNKWKNLWKHPTRYISGSESW